MCWLLLLIQNVHWFVYHGTCKNKYRCCWHRQYMKDGCHPMDCKIQVWSLELSIFFTESGMVFFWCSEERCDEPGVNLTEKPCNHLGNNFSITTIISWIIFSCLTLKIIHTYTMDLHDWDYEAIRKGFVKVRAEGCFLIDFYRTTSLIETTVIGGH